MPIPKQVNTNAMSGIALCQNYTAMDTLVQRTAQLYSLHTSVKISISRANASSIRTRIGKPHNLMIQSNRNQELTTWSRTRKNILLKEDESFSDNLGACRKCLIKKIYIPQYYGTYMTSTLRWPTS